MRNVRILLFLFIFIYSIGFVSAQSIGITSFAGLGKSFIWNNNNQAAESPFLIPLDNDFLDFSGLQRIVITFGVFIDITLFSQFGLSSGITFNSYGTEYSFSDIFKGYTDFSVRFHYLHVPLLISYFDKKDSSFPAHSILSAGIGVDIPIAVDGSGSTPEDNHVDLDNTILGNISPYTISLLLRAQYNIQLSILPISLGIGICYEHQLTGIWKDDFFPDNGNTSFSSITVNGGVSYWF